VVVKLWKLCGDGAAGVSRWPGVRKKEGYFGLGDLARCLLSTKYVRCRHDKGSHRGVLITADLDLTIHHSPWC